VLACRRRSRAREGKPGLRAPQRFALILVLSDDPAPLNNIPSQRAGLTAEFWSSSRTKDAYRMSARACRKGWMELCARGEFKRRLTSGAGITIKFTGCNEAKSSHWAAQKLQA